MLWPHIPNRAMLSYTLHMPQHDVVSNLGLYANIIRDQNAAGKKTKGSSAEPPGVEVQKEGALSFQELPTCQVNGPCTLTLLYPEGA